MDRYNYVTQSWIVSPNARRIYRTSALLSLILYPLLVALQLQEHVPFARQLLFIAILGSAITSVAMEYFLFRFDDSPAVKQILWFAVMLFVPLGPALYCFMVYSKSTLLRGVDASRVESGIS